LNQLGARYDELTQELSSAEIVRDSSRFQKVASSNRARRNRRKHREFKQSKKTSSAPPDVSRSGRRRNEADGPRREKELTARKEVAERELTTPVLPEDPLDEKSYSWNPRPAPAAMKRAFCVNSSHVSRYARNAGWKSKSWKALLRHWAASGVVACDPGQKGSIPN